MGGASRNRKNNAAAGGPWDKKVRHAPAKMLQGARCLPLCCSRSHREAHGMNSVDIERRALPISPATV